MLFNLFLDGEVNGNLPHSPLKDVKITNVGNLTQTEIDLSQQDQILFGSMEGKVWGLLYNVSSERMGIYSDRSEIFFSLFFFLLKQTLFIYI